MFYIHTCLVIHCSKLRMSFTTLWKMRSERSETREREQRERKREHKQTGPWPSPPHLLLPWKKHEPNYLPSGILHGVGDTNTNEQKKWDVWNTVRPWLNKLKLIHEVKNLEKYVCKTKQNYKYKKRWFLETISTLHPSLWRKSFM